MTVATSGMRGSGARPYTVKHFAKSLFSMWSAIVARILTVTNEIATDRGAAEHTHKNQKIKSLVTSDTLYARVSNTLPNDFGSVVFHFGESENLRFTFSLLQSTRSPHNRLETDVHHPFNYLPIP